MFVPGINQNQAHNLTLRIYRYKTHVCVRITEIVLPDGTGTESGCQRYEMVYRYTGSSFSSHKFYHRIK
jgi:hypothetical protein